MNRPTLILLGAGGHARACIDVIEAQGEFDIAGLIGSPAELGSFVLGYPVLGGDADLASLAQLHRLALVTVGQVGSPALRRRLYRQALGLGMVLPTIVSPRAYVSRHARIGGGSIVMHGALINAGAEVGANCIINTNALVEHDARVGDDCHIATGAILNGGVRVGEGGFVGSGSVVREGLTLGRDCLVGMCQSVRRDVADGAQILEKRAI